MRAIKKNSPKQSFQNEAQKGILQTAILIILQPDHFCRLWGAKGSTEGAGREQSRLRGNTD